MFRLNPCQPCCDDSGWSPPPCCGAYYTAFSECYEITLAGITNGELFALGVPGYCKCEDVNGTWQVQHPGGDGCTWTGCYPVELFDGVENPAICYKRDLWLVMILNSSGSPAGEILVRLDIRGANPSGANRCSPFASWDTLSRYYGNMDCDNAGSVTVYLDLDSSHCGGWPEEIVISPC